MSRKFNSCWKVYQNSIRQFHRSVCIFKQLQRYIVTRSCHNTYYRIRPLTQSLQHASRHVRTLPNGFQTLLRIGLNCRNAGHYLELPIQKPSHITWREQNQVFNFIKQNINENLCHVRVFPHLNPFAYVNGIITKQRLTYLFLVTNMGIIHAWAFSKKCSI